MSDQRWPSITIRMSEERFAEVANVRSDVARSNRKILDAIDEAIRREPDDYSK